ncbi:shikimate dehydrogenase family protein [Levilactobacillus suantsaii]|uniref:Shikimate dehydrogenase n=2 Tax=Levilactobacillus suantsaii TaxID=2292255 RepID=A0A4Q0VGH1_9LACO|nr:shikimate dehydrogenase [Levilactobacillus suantsaii]RXI77909.1 shikimate dehydrogenase [Levilactobacillus suantsaii]
MTNSEMVQFGLLTDATHQETWLPQILTWGAARCQTFTVVPGKLPAVMADIRGRGLVGVNLAGPFRRAVVPLVDTLTLRARQTQIVNTVRNDHGRLVGDNTMGAGLFQDLRARGLQVTGRRLVVLGAETLGQAIIAAAVDTGCSQIDVIVPVTASYASQATWLSGLAQMMDGTLRVHLATATTILARLVAQADVVIKATQGTDDPVSLAIMRQLHPGQLVVDGSALVRTSPFLVQAAQQGSETHTGWGCLIWQEALAFQFWTGKVLAVPAMEAELAAHLAPQSVARPSGR